MVRVAVLVLALVAAACAPTPVRPAAVSARDAASVPAFDFASDTFAFPNQIRARNPGVKGLYANYCFVLARGLRQFQQFARFDPAAPRVDRDEYERRVRAVVSRAPWRPPLPPANPSRGLHAATIPCSAVSAAPGLPYCAGAGLAVGR